MIASTSGDYTVKVWDIEAGSSKLSLKVGDVIQSASWSANGSLLVTTSRDKKLRIWDTRQEKPAQETNGHAGAKNSRAVWLGEHDRVATTGFSRMSDRQLALWDIKAPREPLGGFQMLDSISGVCVPFWDDGTQCLYLAGKGDGNIRYYEYENDNFEYLSEYKSADPQRGIAFLPKRGVNMHENEVMRAYKTVNDTHIEPISFIVPRRSETFQEDIYPPTTGLKAAMSSKEWFDGGEGLPPKVSMEGLYNGRGMKEVTNTTITTRTPVPAAEATPRAKPEPTTASSSSSDAANTQRSEPSATQPSQTATRIPSPSMKTQGASMSSMVDRFADKEAHDDTEDDDSSFEEVQRPAERKQATKVVPDDVKEESVSSDTPAVPSNTVVDEVKSTIPGAASGASTSSSAASNEASNSMQAADQGPVADGGTISLEREMRNMKTVIAQQTRQLAALQSTIADLVEQVKTLQR